MKCWKRKNNFLENMNYFLKNQKIKNKFYFFCTKKNENLIFLNEFEREKENKKKEWFLTNKKRKENSINEKKIENNVTSYSIGLEYEKEVVQFFQKINFKIKVNIKFYYI